MFSIFHGLEGPCLSGRAICVISLLFSVIYCGIEMSWSYQVIKGDSGLACFINQSHIYQFSVIRATPSTFSTVFIGEHKNHITRNQ